MSMARISKNLGFTVPPAMVEEFEQTAREERSTKSELFRRMFRLYQSYRTPFRERRGDSAMWAERLIAEAQEEERRSPLSDEAFRTGIEQAVRYGAERAQAVGVTSEEDVNDIVYEERQKHRHASRRS
jgi:hypothetical protein